MTRCGLFVLLLVLAAGARAQTNSDLHLVVGYIRAADGSLELSADLENRTPRAISLPLQRAPWAIHGMEIIVRRVNAHADVVPPGFMIADYPRTLVHLLPGERKGGRFPLAAVTKENAQKLNESDLVVFWYWQPRGIEPRVDETPLHGTLYVPRR